MKPYYLLFLIALGIITQSAHAQELSDDDLYSMSLEELMNVKINSVSKKDESLFDAPLSSYTITSSEIQKAGSNSIMEALRLAPGVIVREQTNGVYDIHLRGFDNILRYSDDYTKTNTATLVMIDNRPVFSHNLGGTLWEALPIDINDVDRIEVVRGPSAPMFGPNAVTGVINIITRKSDADTWANAQVNYGTPSTLIANGTFGKKLSEKFNFAVSTNVQKRERFDELYYTPGDNYVPVQLISANPDKQYPHSEDALNKWGSNLYLNYLPKEKVNFQFSAGLQNAQVQRNFLGSFAGTMFTTNEYKSYYANVAANINGLNLRTSYQGGTDDLNVATAPNKYDHQSFDVVAEYNWFTAKEKIHIVPGLSLQTVKFSDEDYGDDGPTFLNASTESITTSSVYLRTDFKPVENLRLIAAVRADKFSVPDDIYFAYEVAATYKVHKNHLIRTALTRSNSGSFIANNFLNLRITRPDNSTFVRSGQDDLDLFTINMFELGFRSKLTPQLQLDVDFFHQEAEQFTALLFTSPSSQSFSNVPTTASQDGITFSINFVPSQKIQFKPFITLQETNTTRLPSAYNSPAIDPTITYEDSYHRNTPSFYGGYFLDLKATQKLSFNLNGYFFAKHRQYNEYDPTDEGKAGDIKGKFILNAKAMYAFATNWIVFVNGRNILNSDSREYFGTDRIGSLYSAGVSFKLN